MSEKLNSTANSKPECGLILAAAGRGRRFGGDSPKQFLKVDGVPLFLKSVQAFLPVISRLLIVLPPDLMEEAAGSLAAAELGCSYGVCGGGATRQDSVWIGLRRLERSVRLVFVHDAARPFVSEGLVRRVLEGARKSAACIPVIPVSDTVKEISDNSVVRTLDRRRLFLAQTPQCFERALLERAFRKAEEDRFRGTDEAGIVEHLGEPVTIVPGEVDNLKITWAEDLERLR